MVLLQVVLLEVCNILQTISEMLCFFGKLSKNKVLKKNASNRLETSSPLVE